MLVLQAILRPRCFGLADPLRSTSHKLQERGLLERIQHAILHILLQSAGFVHVLEAGIFHALNALLFCCCWVRNHLYYKKNDVTSDLSSSMMLPDNEEDS
jgi:hypothetical protein